MISKDEKTLKRVLLLFIPRWIKTLFFLISMLISFLLFFAPILLVITDALLPSVLLSASLPRSSLTLQAVSSHLQNYDFRYSLIDMPLVSFTRSAIILCVYSFCNGPNLSNGLYMGITSLCCVGSLVFVSLKASWYVFMMNGDVKATEVGLYVSSLSLAIGHVVVAYRTTSRERRKLLVYKIDIEAVAAYKKGFSFPRYQNTVLQEAARTK